MHSTKCPPNRTCRRWYNIIQGNAILTIYGPSTGERTLRTLRLWPVLWSEPMPLRRMPMYVMGRHAARSMKNHERM